MPISKNEFEKGRMEEAYANKVLHFLEGNPTKAFNLDEIVKGVEQKQDPDFVDILKVGAAVMILDFSGKIEARIIMDPSGLGFFYYRARK